MSDGYKCEGCGGDLEKEDVYKQKGRIERGIKGLFPYHTKEEVEEYARNYIGFGPNNMYECKDCKEIVKIIPESRKRKK